MSESIHMTLEEWKRRVKFGTGKELDDLGEPYGIIRIPEFLDQHAESDAAYRQRLLHYVLSNP